MNQILKLILIAIGACIVSIGLMLFIDLIVLVYLGDWTMEMTDKFLVLNWTAIDRYIVRWFPILVVLGCILIRDYSIKRYFRKMIWTFLSLILSVFVAVIFALVFWTSEGGDSAFLPQNIRYQPFENYWTIFIVLGISLPLGISLLHNRNKTDNI